MADQPEVTYVLPGKVGGVLTVVANLLKFRQADGPRSRVVLTQNRRDPDTQFTGALPADVQVTVGHALPVENIHAVARRLHAAIGSGPGVLVCNDALELMMVALIDPGRTVVQILHGDYDYYYDLAVRHEPLVHAFVAISRTVYETLLDRLPQRRDTIFWLPYGVVIPDAVRTAAPGPLRLIYSGRLDEAKGVLDLPLIDEELRRRNVPVRWSVVGNGPAADALWSRWEQSERVKWTPSAVPADIVAACADHDVYVLPSRAEGLSVATVEAMSAGVVPVVTRLPGMAEILDEGRTGFAADVGDIAGFASAIERLSSDRILLEALSTSARRLIVESFDIRQRARGYDELYARWQELYRPRPKDPVVAYGSRLDQPWLPNALVHLVRSGLRMNRR